MNIETLVVGEFGCNCRILSDEKTNEAIIIDPGDEAPSILNYVRRTGLTVKALLHTHAHLDHVMATTEVHRVTQAPIYLHEKDLPLYQNLPVQGQFFGMQLEVPDPVTTFLEDSMEIKWGSNRIKTLHTPGHTPGSCCFYYEGKESLLFSGDTLFLKSIGRTDLWGGSTEQILKSIKQKLYRLDDDTQVLSGHGRDTTIGFEKKNNPFCTY